MEEFTHYWPPGRRRSLPLSGESSLGLSEDTRRTDEDNDDRKKSVHGSSPFVLFVPERNERIHA